MKTYYWPPWPWLSRAVKDKNGKNNCHACTLLKIRKQDMPWQRVKTTFEQGMLCFGAITIKTQSVERWVTQGMHSVPFLQESILLLLWKIQGYTTTDHGLIGMNERLFSEAIAFWLYKWPSVQCGRLAHRPLPLRGLFTCRSGLQALAYQRWSHHEIPRAKGLWGNAHDYGLAPQQNP